MHLTQGLSKSPKIAGAPSNALGLAGYEPHLVYSLFDVYGTNQPVAKLRNSSGDVQDFTSAELLDYNNITADDSAFSTFRGPSAQVVTFDTIYQQNPAISGANLTQSTVTDQPRFVFDNPSTGTYMIQSGTGHFMTADIPSSARNVLKQDLAFAITAMSTGVAFGSVDAAFFCINTDEGTGGNRRGFGQTAAFTTTPRFVETGEDATATVAVNQTDQGTGMQSLILRSEGNSNGNNLRNAFVHGSKGSDETTDVGDFNGTFTKVGLFHYPNGGTETGIPTTLTLRAYEFIIYAKTLTDADVTNIHSVQTYNNRTFTTTKQANDSRYN